MATTAFTTLDTMVENARIQSVLSDLKNIDVEAILAKIQNLGILNTARIYGYEVNEYQNLEASGRLLMLHQQQVSPKTFKEFFIRVRHLVADDVYDFVMEHGDALQAAIDKRVHNDYDCDWFSASTEVRQYLWKPNFDEDPVETVQYQHMRLAVQFYFKEPNGRAVDEIIECYQMLSDGYGTHASPTIFNACRKEPQMSSCFLKTVGDNLPDILYGGVGDGGMISKANGGLGFDVSPIRHSEINGTGMSQGVVPMLLLYNMAVRYVDQGGRRKGAATVYLRPHHIDIEAFVEMVDKVGDQYTRAHDLNTAVWFPWLFWDRVRTDGDWTMFCPAKSQQLNDVWGKEFERIYVATEQAQPGDKWYVAPAYRKTIKARDLIEKIVDMQIKTGMPYVMHADACNLKSNHRHLGYIRCGNLCLAVIEFTSEDEIASCNLASLSLRKCVTGRYTEAIARFKPGAGYQELALQRCYDFNKLGQVTRRFVRNLNKVIDNNWYPLDRTSKKTGKNKPGKIRYSNERHRPIGLGVSGLAEALHAIDLPFVDPDSQKAAHPVTKIFNKMIFASMYFNGLLESVQLAITEGKHESFDGSPFSEGKLQFDLWEEEAQIRGHNQHRTKEDNQPVDPPLWGQGVVSLYDADGDVVATVEPTWDALKAVIMRFGTRNSLILTIMPTATTAQKLRNCEAAEAHTANLYSRKVMNGGYPVINRYLIDDLRELGLWNLNAFQCLAASGGSIKNFHTFVDQHRDKFPDFTNTAEAKARLTYVQVKYLTMWEIPQRVMLRYTADRGRYIDQSQSTNVYMPHPTQKQLIAMHLYTDELGLKTGMYYLRQQPPTDPVKFTVDSSIAAYVKSIDASLKDGKPKTPEIVRGITPGFLSDQYDNDEVCEISYNDEGEMVKSCCA